MKNQHVVRRLRKKQCSGRKGPKGPCQKRPTGWKAEPGSAFLPPRLRLSKDYPYRALSEVVCALSDVLEDPSLAATESAVRQRTVAALKGIDLAYGLQSINRTNAEPLHKVAVRRLVSSLITKHEKVCDVTADERKSKCLSDVIALDRTLDFNRAVLTDPVFTVMKEEMTKLLGTSPDLTEISENCKHGPGSSTEHTYEYRSKYFKYRDWPYACSPRAGVLLRHVIQSDPRWVGVLDDSYRTRYGIPKWAILNQDAFWANIVRAELLFNRITSVPKDGSKDRPIAIEPPGNVFLQLGIDQAFRTRLRVYGNPIDTQSRNRQLALEGSRTGRLATLDLSNASDTLHRDLIRELLPGEWFDLLDSVRSPFGLLPDGTAWRYAKMSSMGNATTFVLETAVFLTVCRAVSRCFGMPSKDTISVFGDDIIVPTYLYTHVRTYLELIGCQVNEAKSFASGPVRESCGVDAYEGQDIRPVQLKRQPTTDLDIYADRNRLHLWWKRHIGLAIPCRLDAFFFRFLQLEPLFGPETPEDVRSHLFDESITRGSYLAYAETSAEVPAGDFGFRKLMHTLRGSSEGGMFAVAQASQRLRVVRLGCQS